MKLSDNNNHLSSLVVQSEDNAKLLIETLGLLSQSIGKSKLPSITTSD